MYTLQVRETPEPDGKWSFFYMGDPEVEAYAYDLSGYPGDIQLTWATPAEAVEDQGLGHYIVLSFREDNLELFMTAHSGDDITLERTNWILV